MYLVGRIQCNGCNITLLVRRRRMTSGWPTKFPELSVLARVRVGWGSSYTKALHTTLFLHVRILCYLDCMYVVVTYKRCDATSLLNLTLCETIRLQLHESGFFWFMTLIVWSKVGLWTVNTCVAHTVLQDFFIMLNCQELVLSDSYCLWFLKVINDKENSIPRRKK